MAEKRRCEWASNELSIAYHDEEWGVPVHDDRHFFEMLILEGAQAGLSWDTILRRRQGYRRAYENFDPCKVATFGEKKQATMLEDPGIIRNRAKIRSSVQNASAFLAVQDEFGSFDKYVWRFVGGTPIVRAWKALTTVPATTPESDTLSKDLRKRGFSFVGSTIVYAFMQATGLVNDHMETCFRFRELTKH